MRTLVGQRHVEGESLLYLRENRSAHKEEAKMEGECWQRHHKAAQFEY
jgi:hypothetical protein